MNAPDVDLRVMEKLVTQIRQNPAAQTKPFTPQTRFVADLGLKSLELIGLVFICEQTFNVQLTAHPGLIAKLHTVGQALDVIHLLQQGGVPEHYSPLQEADAL